MAYDGSTYDVTPLIRNQAPLDEAGIDYLRALTDPDGVDQEISNRAMGLAPASLSPKYQTQQVPASVAPRGGATVSAAPAATVQPTADDTESAVSGDFNALRDRMRKMQGRSAQLRSAKDSLATPTDPNQAQYRPTVGRRILRGLGGAGMGLLRGGIGGAVAGAVAPQLTTGVGYDDPNKAFRKVEDARTRKLAGVDTELADAEAQRKDEFDTGKELGTMGNTLAERQNTTQRYKDQAKHEGSEDSAKMNDLHQQLGKATAEALQAGRDPRQDKTVQQLSDTIQGAMKEPAEKNPNDIALDQAEAKRLYPNDPAKQYKFVNDARTKRISAGAQARQDAKPDKPTVKPVTPAQSVAIESRKNKKIDIAKANLKQGYDSQGNPFTEDDYKSALDQAQLDYEGEIGSARGAPLETHTDITGNAPADRTPPAAPKAAPKSEPAKPAPKESPKSNATPQTHAFSLSKWKAANPKGDVEAAKKKAKSLNYRIVD
jgi:hypothetical protein